MGPVIVIAALTFLVAGGIVEFNRWRSRRNLSAGYTATLIAVALLGVVFLAFGSSLNLWPAAVAMLAMFALSQQNRIENLLVQCAGAESRHHRGTAITHRGQATKSGGETD
ncbi:MAG: hypothetical protein ABSC32_03185 [Steroidobacteraceae bacterium]|jgi:intracellular septation protein A